MLFYDSHKASVSLFFKCIPCVEMVVKKHISESFCAMNCEELFL